jgi:hypothetical protein
LDNYRWLCLGDKHYAASSFIRLFLKGKSKSKLEKEKRAKYINDIKERLEDIALTKLNKRRYKDKEYAQNQVDKCFQGPKHYLRKVFGNPTVEDKQGRLELVYALNEELLKRIEKKDGLYPVVKGLLPALFFKERTI